MELPKNFEARSCFGPRELLVSILVNFSFSECDDYQNGVRTGEIAMNSTYWAPFAAHNTRTVQVKRSTPILCNLIRLILDLFHRKLRRNC